MRLLFVCLGNICRSPAAETVLRELLDREGLSSSSTVDSAGTTGYHIGEEPDPRMRQELAQRGYKQWSRARLVEAKDFYDFDIILAMDQQNMRELRRLCPKPELLSKLRLACSFCSRHHDSEVPDPYYGSKSDFAYVVTLVEDISEGIIQNLKQKTLLT